MGILRSYLGNQLSDNPRDTGDFFSNYLSQQLNQPTANVTPQSTTINYNNDGSVDVTHKQNVMHEPMEQVQPVPVAPPPMPQMPQAGPGVQTASINQQLPQLPPPGAVQNATQVNNAPPAPQQPPPQPVAPQPGPAPQFTQNPTFNRMVQTESGGQQMGPNGQILTSPKGAQGMAQIMPTTAVQPGYGIKPATPQELATPEGNLAFGQRYYEGMFNKFGQDPEKAAAAYNAGPGTIEKAMLQADRVGGSWKDYIPAETKKYLTDVFPKHQEEAGKKMEVHLANLAQVRSDTGVSAEEQAIHHAVLNSGDLNAIGQGAYAGGQLIDPATKRAYADQHATLLEKAKMENEAPKKAAAIIENGGTGLQRALKDDSEEGSYLKAYLFQRLGLTALAKEEQQKLGAGDVWAQTMIDGKPAWVKFNAQGAPVKGYNADAELTPKELVQAMSMKGVQQHTQAYKDKGTGEIYFLQTTPQGPRLVTTNGKQYAGDTSNLFAYGIGSDIPLQAEKAFQVSGASTQGKAGAEGYQINPLPARPGGAPVAPATMAPVTTPNAVQQNQQNQQPPAGSNIRNPAQSVPPQGATQVVQAPGQGGVYTNPPVAPQVQGAAAAPGTPLYQQRIQGERMGKRGETVDKVIDTEYREQANAGDMVKNTRKSQFAIFERPDVNAEKLFGLYNAAGEDPSNQKIAIIRDILGGVFKPENEVSQRIAQLDLTPAEKSALIEYNRLNQSINASTLKQNSGPGSISDAEQRANKEANVDITRSPALGAFNGMAQSQFNGDLARARHDWAADQNFSNSAQMDKAWRKEQTKLTELYANIAKQRAEFIAKNSVNGTASAATVRDGYRRFPVPEYDPNANDGRGGWIKTKPLADIFGPKKGNT